MSDDSAVRFAYRFLPVYATVVWSIMAAVPLGTAIYVWIDMGGLLKAGMLTFPLILWLISAGMLVRIGFLRTVSLIVEGDNLIVVRRPLIRLFGTFTIYPRDCIRHVRYRFEITEYRDRRSSSISIYFLDLVKTDGQTVILVQSSEQPLPRNMPRNLAAALRVDYQDHVLPPA